MSDFYYEHYGYCPICASPTKFVAREQWFRDHYFCERCGSMPRQRALTLVLEDAVPNWRDVDDPRSPHRPARRRIGCARSVPSYLASHCYPGVPAGTLHQGFRCEDLEQLTFADGRFELVMTQEVFEHVFDYRRAFREVMRTVRPGGAHVFTTPKYKHLRKYPGSCRPNQRRGRPSGRTRVSWEPDR